MDHASIATQTKYEKILNKIIKTLDPLVDHVAQSTELNKCFNIFFKNGMQTLPVEDGRSTLDMPRLSSGTKYAFNLAYVYLAVKEKLNGFFYVDEQFSYINNDIEKAFISLLSAMVEEDDQIIFTTHNTDILDLNLPNHAYGFLKKVDLKISYQNAAEVEKKNNKMTKKAVLVIMDGFGINKSTDGNAIYTAPSPRLDDIFTNYPNTHIINC